MDALEQLLAEAKAGRFAPPGMKRRRGQANTVSLPKTGKTPVPDNAIYREALEERAAILEFDAGLSREEADFLAPTCLFWKAETMQQVEMLPRETVSDTIKNNPTPAHALLEQAGVKVVPVLNQGHAADVVTALCALPDNATPWGLDIETTPRPEWRTDTKAGLDPHKAIIRTVQIYPGGGECFVFDVGTRGLSVLAPLWERPMVAHNAVFELKFLLQVGANLTRVDCTKLQANALHGTLPSLKDLSAAVLGWKMDKALQLSDFGGELSQAQLDYAALDAVAAFKLAQVQGPALGERARCYRLMADAQKAIARLELSGCPFDVEAHGRLMARWQTTAEAARGELDSLIAGVNPDSPQQLSKWLAANLPADLVETWPKTAGGSLQTDADTLAGLTLPALEPLARYKTARKLLSTYGTGYKNHINPVTGRLHPSFLLGGTATGRLACRTPNIQNPPRGADFRALFAPAPGRVFVVADYSQVELRVAAIVSGDAAMLAAYDAGEDLHRKTAGAVLKKAPGEVTKTERQMAKAVGFGLLFGQGAKGLQRYAKASYGVEMSQAEAEKARREFFKAYPGLSLWQTETRKAAERAGQVRTPGGRVRKLDGKGVATECLNTPIQGGAAEAMLAALAVLEPQLAGLGAALVNVVHDELVVECDPDNAGAVAHAVEAAMVAGFAVIFPRGSTRDLVEAHTGANWAAAKG